MKRIPFALRIPYFLRGATFAVTAGILTVTIPAASGQASAGARRQTVGQKAASGNTLTGIVTDVRGKPIAGAQVALYHQISPGVGESAGEVITTANGHFVVHQLAAGEQYSIQVLAKGYGDAYLSPRVLFHDKTRTITRSIPTFVLPRADSFVAGTIVDTQGQPIPGVELMMDPERGQVMTDDWGKFRLEGMVPGRISLLFHDPRPPGNRQQGAVLTVGRSDNRIVLLTEAEAQQRQQQFEALMRRTAQQSHGDGTPAAQLQQQALTRARATNRGVLLVFHASWCGPCVLLHHFLSGPTVKPILAKYLIVQEVDIWENDPARKAWNNPGGEKLYAKYGTATSVPFWVMLRADGTVGGTGAPPGRSNMGKPTSPGDIDWFLRSFKAVAPTLTDTDAAALRTQLQKASSP